MTLSSRRENEIFALQEQFQKDKTEIDKKYAKLYAKENEHVYVSDFMRDMGIGYNYAQHLIMYLFMVGHINEDNHSLTYSERKQ